MSGAPAEIDIVAIDDASDIFQTISENFGDMNSNVSEASGQISNSLGTVTSSVSSLQTQAATPVIITANDEATSTLENVESEADALESNSKIQFNITANDAASPVLQNAANNASVSMGQVKVTQDDAGNTSDKSAQQFSNSAMQMNMMAMSGTMLFNSVNSVENAQTSLSRAHLTAEKAANSVTLAQQTYNLAVEHYGETSLQAQDAQNKLALAEQTQSVDQERVSEAQRNYNSSLLSMATSIIPTATSAIMLVANASKTWEGIQAGLNLVMDANPIILVGVAVAALVVGIVLAYEDCKPFRDLINDIGHVIGGSVLSAFNALKSAGDALWNALNSAYSNVLLPVANFFKEVLVADLNIALIPVKAFETAIGSVANAVKPLSDLIGGLGSALSHLCFAHAAPAAEEFNKQVTQSISLSDQLAHKTNTLGSSLQGLAGNVSVKGGGGTSNVTIGAPNITIGNISGSASLKQTRDAVNKGLCDAMYKKGIMNKVT